MLYGDDHPLSFWEMLFLSFLLFDDQNKKGEEENGTN